MTREFVADRLDVMAFAEADGTLSRSDPIKSYPRLIAEMAEPTVDSTVRWHAVGACRNGSTGAPAPWLHLNAQVRANLICQRCLESFDIDLHVDRWFRFAVDEAAAAFEDEQSEEDVLAASRDFDLRALVEDELLMELPAVPRHDVCPRPVQLSTKDPDFEIANEPRPNPFAAIGALRARKGN